MNYKPRETFTSSLGTIAATLGSAIGLGNIWKFPALTGENGGAAFLFIYLFCVVFIGLPVMLAEFIIGRKTRSNAIGAFKKLEPKKPWFLVGWMGVLSSILILAFYTTVVGWILAYIFKALSGSLSGIDANGAVAVFEKVTANPVSAVLWQLAVFALISLIIMAGVQKGIERITKTLLPLLFVLLLICDIRALTLPGAKEGLSFLFNPDFSKVTGMVVLIAMGLSFFKLSIGMGTMLTYGSYMQDEDNMLATAGRVVIADTVVSLMAGMAVFPAVFAFGFEPASGPPLLFFTIPMVFNSMPLGQVFLVLFFVLAFIATIGAMISMLEVPVAFMHEEWGLKRNTAVIVTVLVIASVGSLATLSGSILSHVLILGKNFFDLFDFTASNILMPLGGLIIAVYTGWKIRYKDIQEELSNRGAIEQENMIRLFSLIVRYITPIAILIIMLNGLGIIKF
ncbi:MAG: sodium-dependent transporter [Thermosyntropha sp.]|nr:sodium-dependent transporter [Thermosyntropha sp.]